MTIEISRSVRHAEIRIYVACLAAYNSGRLHGRWIDATLDRDEIYAEINDMLSRSPCPGAEEFAIHDYEGFGDYRLSEYESIDRVVEIAEGIEMHGLAFAAFMAYDDSRDPDDFQEAYRGQWDSEREFIENLVDECGPEIPENLSSYIDWDAMTRDYMMDFTAIIDGEGGVFIFGDF